MDVSEEPDEPHQPRNHQFEVDGEIYQLSKTDKDGRWHLLEVQFWKGYRFMPGTWKPLSTYERKWKRCSASDKREYKKLFEQIPVFPELDFGGLVRFRFRFLD
jgi:hypothetical protein